MAEFPALPLFTDAYLADTRHLNAAQHGAYLLLLMMAWRMPDCALPDEDEKLSRWAAMDLRTWRNNKSVIMEFWKLGSDAKWRQSRLIDERERVEDKRSKNVAAGKASALKRHNTRSTPVQPDANQNPTIPNPEPYKKEEADDARAESIFQLGQRIAEITGWADDPNWRGNYSRLKVWIETGHDPVLDIIPAITATMQKRKGRGPPKTLNYFDGPVSDAKATRLQPMPEGKSNGQPTTATGKSKSAYDAIREGLELPAQGQH